MWQIFGRKIDYSWKILETHKFIKNYEHMLAEFLNENKEKERNEYFLRPDYGYYWWSFLCTSTWWSFKCTPIHL